MNITEITSSNQDNKKIIRLAPYCRVSSDSTDQIHSFAAQIKYYSEYAKNNPQYQLVDIYADEGITGTSMKNRDDLNRLIRDCVNGKIDRVIVKSVSRLARNTEELLSILRLLKKHDVSVYFEEQGIDTEKMNMEMIVTFPGMAAQQESENISGNLRWSIKKRMELGDYLGVNAPYGYRFIDGKLVINNDEAIIVKRIFEMFLAGMGRQAIANVLNKEKISRGRNEKSNTWYYHTISYILENERYIGDALLQKQFMTDTLPYHQVENHGQKPKYYVENSNPPIISRETFDAVKRLINARRVKEKKNNEKNIFSGKIKCSCCGSSFRRQIINGESYWNCLSKSANRTNCKSILIKDDEIKEAFIMLSIKLKDNSEDIVESTLHYLRKLYAITDPSKDIISNIDKTIADLCARNLVISQLYAKKILNFSEFTSQSTEFNTKISELRSKRKKILSDNEDNIVISALNTLCNIVSETEIEPCFNTDLFNEIVERIVANDNNTITFYLIGGIALTEHLINKRKR